MKRRSFLLCGVVALFLWGLGACSGDEKGAKDNSKAQCQEGTMRCEGGRLVQNCVASRWTTLDDCEDKDMFCVEQQGVAFCSEEEEADTSLGTGTLTSTDTGSVTGNNVSTSDTQTATGSDTDSQGGNGTDTEAPGTETETETITSTGSEPQSLASLSGLVQAPSGIVPISGALVYLTKWPIEDIPMGVYHYECDDMSGMPYTLSGPDGTWRIENVPPGTWKMVTRKGNFRRVRTLEVPSQGGDIQVPWEDTTLPGKNSDDGLDRVPSMAVLLTDWDRTYNLLGKFGMGQVDAKGELNFGTESFEIYNDEHQRAGYPPSSELFTEAGRLEEYHMVFLPCSAKTNPVAFVNSHAESLREYVSKGGKVYNSCCVALWIVAPFPDYIQFHDGNATTKYDIGRISGTPYSTLGTLNNDDLSAWMMAVANLGPGNVPFTDGYVKINATVDVNDGHGLEEDDGWVKPYTWVTDSDRYKDSPLMVTYNYGHGKVFYSVYETSNLETVELTPQEQVLLYVMLEIGVCESLPPI